MEEPAGNKLHPARQHRLEEIRGNIGGRQVSAKELYLAPSWILEEAFNLEMSDNWDGAYELVDEWNVPRSANKIGCHAVFKVKDATVHREIVLKACNVLHGNRDQDSFTVRRDSSSADLSVVRLVIYIGPILGFSFGTADVKGAYLQSGPALRDIYVRAPKEFKCRGKIWKLPRLPYGIVEAGRQWLWAIEDWMMHKYGMERVLGVDQLFTKRLPDSRICLLVAKVVDDFFLSGSENEIRQFFSCVNKDFKLGATLSITR